MPLAKKVMNSLWTHENDSEIIVSSQKKILNSKWIRGNDNGFIEDSRDRLWIHCNVAKQIMDPWWNRKIDSELAEMIIDQSWFREP